MLMDAPVYYSEQFSRNNYTFGATGQNDSINYLNDDLLIQDILYQNDQKPNVVKQKS